ncbi:hypothetical protein ACHAXA_004737 [Cyclostephanos tholiformis]|uniref:Uncharacterized protein n=1 Tax=Cyclostephanos tholiformis TaxID=382380 RepID=A0ABD3SRS8_9STRA
MEAYYPYSMIDTYWTVNRVVTSIEVDADQAAIITGREVQRLPGVRFQIDGGIRCEFHLPPPPEGMDDAHISSYDGL